MKDQARNNPNEYQKKTVELTMDNLPPKRNTKNTLPFV